MQRARVLAAGVCLFVCVSTKGAAQTLPTGPLEFGDGQVTIAADVAATFGGRDDFSTTRPSYFNYTDYEHNALRMFRVSFTGAWRPSPRIAFLTELRSEDLEQLHPYAMFVRVRPWIGRAFDVQVGRIPPVFGAYSRRGYASDNRLIGQPLAYQYLTSLRPDAVPATADDLLVMRARGWRSSFPVGNPSQAPGVPIMSAYQWDVGIEASVDVQHFEAAAAVTSGTLSNPRVDDDNDGRQLSARAAWKPVVGMIVGVSVAHGEWLNGALKESLSPVLKREHFPQDALALDAEYSRDYWLVRGEFIRNRWRIPELSDSAFRDPLGATSAFVESRYRFTARLYAAGRVDRLTFSKIQGSSALFAPLGETPWEAPVTRVEVGGGVYLQRNLIFKTVVQRNWRPDAGLVHNRTFVSGQLAFWF